MGLEIYSNLGKAARICQRNRPAAAGSLRKTAAEADPLVLHLLIMLLHVVKLDRKLELGRDQSADRSGEIEFCQRSIVLRGDELRLGREELLVGDQHVEHCAGADQRLLLRALEGDLSRAHGRRERGNAGPRSLQGRPELGGRLYGRPTCIIHLAAPLPNRLLGLAGLRINGASFVKRHGQLRCDLSGIDQSPLEVDGLIVRAVQIADDRDLRQQLAAHDIDIVAGGEFGEGCRDQTEVVVRGKAQCLFARGGKRRTLPRQYQSAGRMPDGPDILGAADLQRSLLGDQGTLGLRERGLGLCDVGAGDFADAKTVLRRLELLAQDLDIVEVDLDQGLVADYVEICLSDRLENRRLDSQRLRPRRLYGIDRLAGLRLGPATPVDRLIELEYEGVGPGDRVAYGSSDAGRDSRGAWLVLKRGGRHADLAGEVDGRAPK